jgi:hypothetical protein
MQSVNEDRPDLEREIGTTSVADGPKTTAKGGFASMAPGHVITAHMEPGIRKIQKNAVKWLLREI